MAKAAKKDPPEIEVENKEENTGDAAPKETPKETPREPDETETGDLENKREGKRESLWTDICAKLERRIKGLEDSQIVGTIWTTPAILACSAVAVALVVAFGALYIAIKGWPKFGGNDS